jgi:biotin synthase-related radical SAM superfamily protein
MLNTLVPAGVELGFLGLDQDLDVVDVRHVVRAMSDFLILKQFVNLTGQFMEEQLVQNSCIFRYLKFMLVIQNV